MYNLNKKHMGKFNIGDKIRITRTSGNASDLTMLIADDMKGVYQFPDVMEKIFTIASPPLPYRTTGPNYSNIAYIVQHDDVVVGAVYEDAIEYMDMIPNNTSDPYGQIEITIPNMSDGFLEEFVKNWMRISQNSKLIITKK